MGRRFEPDGAYIEKQHPPGCCFLYSPLRFTEVMADNEITSQEVLHNATETVLHQDIHYPHGGHEQISSSVMTIPPGTETARHRHDTQMFSYILEGELTVTYDGGEVKTYRAGEAMIEAIGTVHWGRNDGNVPVRVLVVHFGEEGVENTVRVPE